MVFADFTAQPTRRRRTRHDRSRNAQRAVLAETAERPCLHELFESQADTSPDAPALISGEICLTYAELESWSNKLARLLRERGIGPGSFVGLCLERSQVPILAILACLKAGAAYVPLDPAHPDERLSFIAAEAELSAVLTDEVSAGRLGAMLQADIVSLEEYADQIEAMPDRRLKRIETGLLASDVCYVLYTSGTTGRPKGVVAEHRNVTHFVEAFNESCTTTSADRIFQGFALSFDGSVEEIWMAFSNGAALVVPEQDTPRFGNELARYLAKQGITYFSTVPTLLSTMTEDIPSLTQLVLSGEACPPELVNRWAKPGRRMLNVYGPTEATVNTTAALLEAERPVTIGLPIPGYRTLILDDEMQPVAPGEKGELYVGGPGIARGYLNQPELTANSFVRLYKTGDLARINDEGELEFFGRIDSQVKLRGYRVELAEIEAVLVEQPEICSAVVRLYDGGDGEEAALAAYVVVTESCSLLDRARILAALQERLPAYMVPAYLDVLDAMPMLTTGKVDRKALPHPKAPLVAPAGETEAPSNPLEEQIAAAFARLFRLETIDVNQNFFLDLGGHSLLAAKLTGALHEGGIEIATRDIYSFPTVRQLAEQVALTRRQRDSRAHDRETPQAGASGVQAMANVARRPGLAAYAVQLFYYLILLPAIVLPVFILVMPPLVDMLYFRRDITEVLLYLTALGFVLWPVFLVLGIASKWLIIGRYKPGAYPLWGSYYLRWWLTTRLQTMSGAGLFAGTPLAPFMWRLMGARVGTHCLLQCRSAAAWDCISIGDDTSIGPDTQLSGARVENGYLLIGKVEIGNRCFIGSHAVLGLDCRMGDDALLDDQSLLADAEAIPPGKAYRGSPAAEAPVAVPDGPPLRRSSLYLAFYCLSQIACLIIFGLVLGMPAMLIGLSLSFTILHASVALWLPLVIGAVPVSIMFGCCYLAWCKHAVLPSPRPGTYELYSFDYLQIWLVSLLMGITRAFGWLIFTTVFLPPWMRLMGARLGEHTEMSTVWRLYPDMLKAKDAVFFADGSMICATRHHLGRFRLLDSTIGNRSFLGNNALLPAGAGLGNECLLGVLSVPAEPTKPMPDGTDWLGSPAFLLPNRQRIGGFDETATYAPTPMLYVKRSLIDLLRILIPPYLGAFVGITSFIIAIGIYSRYGIYPAFAAGICLAWVALMLFAGAPALLKRLVIGTFKPEIVPLWSRYVWLNEMIVGIYETLAAPAIGFFYGTPFAAPILRLMGCKVGRHCYIGTNLVSEFDLVSIGDHVALNDAAIVQTHLFEDRVMKSDYLRIGDGCSVGNMAVVLYDTRMEDGARLAPLSLLMKGETMPAGAHWRGIPTVREASRQRGGEPGRRQIEDPETAVPAPG